MDKNHPTKQLARLGCLCAVLALAACASEQKAPATADVAVSRHAVENAVAAGAAELAPEEVSAVAGAFCSLAQAASASTAHRQPRRASCFVG